MLSVWSGNIQTAVDHLTANTLQRLPVHIQSGNSGGNDEDGEFLHFQQAHEYF